MKLQGRAFDGTCSMWHAYRDLEALAGSAWWIHEYDPVDYDERDLVEYLLWVLCGYDLCCAVGGAFTCYTAEMISDFRFVSLFAVACENVHLLNLIQARPNPIFNIGPFTFELVQRDENLEFSYIVTLGDDAVLVVLTPIDSTSREVGSFSNLDFAHFLWKYNEQYNFCRRSIIAFPIRGRVRILYVQHHRARIDGWMTELCDTCAREVYDAAHESFGCSQQPACMCVICVRQPPTLKPTAAHVVFTMVLNLERFRVTPSTSYHHFLYAYNSRRVALSQLVPPGGAFVVRQHHLDPLGGRRITRAASRLCKHFPCLLVGLQHAHT
jgi:hypothetical protein